MAANSRVDVPKSQTKHAKAMIQRSRQVLKEELKNIDSKYSKSLFNLNRELEETRNTLKALRVSQKQARRNSVVCKKGINISSIVPTPPLMRRRRASSFPYETHDPLKSVQRCQSSKARPPERSRKNVEMKADRKKDKITMVYDQLNGCKSQMNMKDTGEATEEKDDELEMNEKQRETRESEQPDETESLISSSAFDTFEVASDLRMKMEEIQEGVGIKVAEGLETSNAGGLSTNIAVVQEDLGTKMTTSASQDLDSHVSDDLGTSKLTVDQLKEPGDESNPVPSKQSSPGNEVDEKPVDDQEANIQGTLRHFWTNDDDGKKGTADKYSMFFGNKANISPKKRIFARRASSPDIMIPTTRTEPVLNRPKTVFSRCPPNLTDQHETNKGNTSAKAPRKPVLTRRVSSPDLMATVPCPEKSKPSLLGRATSSTYESNKDNTSFSRKRLLARRASSPDLMLTVPGSEKFKQSFGRPGGLASTHETNKDSTSTVTPRRRRRASSPNLMSPEDAVKFSFEHRQHLSSIQELSHGSSWMEISPPLEKPPLSRTRARRSSIAVMTGVMTPLVPGLPTSMSVFHSLPDIKTRDSIQENQVQDSLRKISRRLTTALTGAQLEKRLQAHRVDAAALQTKVACTPESKAPNKLEMSDLQDCRYLRRRSVTE